VCYLALKNLPKKFAKEKKMLGLYGRKKKSHFAGKMDFLAEGKKSYYTEKNYLTKVILSKKWFSPQKVTFFPYNMD
jgi:hypothetical protein